MKDAESFETPLPSEQWDYRAEGLEALDERVLHTRREYAFIVFAGIFLASLAMLNILGITRFLDVVFWVPGSGDWELKFGVAVGVLPYPITFLCTDFISELYGRKRANFVVFVGFLVNVWVVAVLWLGGVWPGYEATPGEGIFYDVRTLAFGAVGASMVAYLAAQFVDVYVFHFWKDLTRGKHLWLRNNGSTLVSQLVDTTAVVLITHFYAGALPVVGDAPLVPQLLAFVFTGYLFKMIVALLDTGPFMIGTHYLVRYLRLPPPGAAHQVAETADAGLAAA